MDRDTVVRMVRHFLSPVVTKAVAASVVGCALLASSTQARAQDPATAPPPAAAAAGALGQGFGETGQLVISGEMNAGFTKVNHAGWVFAVKPAADYFIVPSVSVGAAIGFALGNDDQKGFEIGARGGYNLNVTENVGVWPIVGISYNKVTGANNSGFSSTYGNLYVPLLYHIVPHVFVGLGPFYNLKLTGDGEHSYGVRSTVAAWF